MPPISTRLWLVRVSVQVIAAPGLRAVYRKQQTLEFRARDIRLARGLLQQPDQALSTTPQTVHI